MSNTNKTVVGFILLLAVSVGLWFGLDLLDGSASPDVQNGRGQLTDVRIGYLRIGSDLPFFVGQNLGIFEEHGLNVIPTRLGSSNQVMDAIVQGDIDATDITGSSVVFSEALNHPDAFRIFMASLATEDKNIHQLIAREGSGIDEVTDLPGKRLAVFPGSQMRVYVRLFLSEYLSPEVANQVELVPLSPPQQRDAIENSDVDAALTLEPTGTQLRESGLGRLILSNVLYETISKPRPFVTAFATIRTEWATSSPDAAQSLVEAYQEISQLIQTQPGLVREVYAQRLSLDGNVAASVSIYNYPVVPNINVDNLRSTAQLLVDNNELSQVPTFEQLMFDPESLPVSGMQQPVEMEAESVSITGAE